MPTPSRLALPPAALRLAVCLAALSIYPPPAGSVPAEEWQPGMAVGNLPAQCAKLVREGGAVAGQSWGTLTREEIKWWNAHSCDLQLKSAEGVVPVTARPAALEGPLPADPRALGALAGRHRDLCAEGGGEATSATPCEGGAEILAAKRARSGACGAADGKECQDLDLGCVCQRVAAKRGGMDVRCHPSPLCSSPLGHGTALKTAGPREAYAVLLNTSPTAADAAGLPPSDHGVVWRRENGIVNAVLLLQHALEKSGASRPLVALTVGALHPDHTKSLQAAGVALLPIPRVEPPASSASWTRSHWTKLAAWGVSEYDKLVLLDVDVLPFCDLDALFSVDAPAYTAERLDKNLARMEPNTGVGVVAPSPQFLSTLLVHLQDAAASRTGGDQGYLSSMLPPWHELPRGYDVLRLRDHGHPPIDTSVSELDDRTLAACAVHYVGPKPYNHVCGAYLDVEAASVTDLSAAFAPHRAYTASAEACCAPRCADGLVDWGRGNARFHSDPMYRLWWAYYDEMKREKGWGTL